MEEPKKIVNQPKEIGQSQQYKKEILEEGRRDSKKEIVN